MSAGVTIDPQALADLSEALRHAPADERPALARRLLLVAIAHIHPETGHVELGAPELAELLQSDVRTISRAASALTNLGALRRERMPIRGRPGSGIAVYFVNPALAWSGDPAARARWQSGFQPLGRRDRVAGGFASGN